MIDEILVIPNTGNKTLTDVFVKYIQQSIHKYPILMMSLRPHLSSTELQCLMQNCSDRIQELAQMVIRPNATWLASLLSSEFNSKAISILDNGQYEDPTFSSFESGLHPFDLGFRRSFDESVQATSSLIPNSLQLESISSNTGSTFASLLLELLDILMN